MRYARACMALSALPSARASLATPAAAEPVKNIVLVHGAWVDGSGWKPIFEILSKEGFHVSMVQEPESFVHR